MKPIIALTPLLSLLIVTPVSGRSHSRRKSLVDTVTREVQAELVALPQDGETCFSPDENCDLKLVKLLTSATKSLDIAIFDLTHVQIAHQILLAARRIPVRVLADRRQAREPHSLVGLLVKGKVDVRFGYQRGIMHNKFTVVDGKMVETGSYNYTNAATEKNNENQLYVATPSVVKRYAERFEKIWSEGTPVAPSMLTRRNR